MSSPPAPPPPPPPPLPPPVPTKNGCSGCESSKHEDYVFFVRNTIETFNELSGNWAADYPELAFACTRILSLRKPPEMMSFQRCEAIRQNGPTCGIVALCMMLNNKVSVEKILNIALLKKYTNNGEMFSCFNMAKLTKKALNICNIRNARVYLQKGGLCSEATINKLFNKCFILIPYDSDCNHAPCLKKGHRAHWALICGIIKAADGPYYAVYRQGKSNHISVWPLNDLYMSNMNLVEVSPELLKDDLKYVVPLTGIGEKFGLRNRYIIVEGLNS